MAVSAAGLVGQTAGDGMSDPTNHKHSVLSVRSEIYASQTYRALWGRNESGEFQITSWSNADERMCKLKAKIESMIRMCGGDPGGEGKR